MSDTPEIYTHCMVDPKGRVLSGGNASSKELVIAWFLRECVHAAGRSMDDYERMGYKVVRFVPEAA